MKQILLIACLLFSSLGQTKIDLASVHSINKIDGENYLVKLKNGKVEFVSSEQQIEQFSDMIKPSYSFSLNEEAPIFEPTIIEGLKEAKALFQRLNSNYKRSSECSNRAHVWAYEEFLKNQIKSNKVFLFFTASYINRHHFKWWFHVAPLYKVRVGNQIVDYVFDYMFDSEPRLIKQWTDNFVFSKRSCKRTTKFSEYDVNPQTEDCYLMIESMYYWMPTDLQDQETSGKYKVNFYPYEIKGAYDQAF